MRDRLMVRFFFLVLIGGIIVFNSCASIPKVPTIPDNKNVYTHADLVGLSEIELPVANSQKGCPVLQRISKATINASLILGEDYELGKDSVRAQIKLNIKPFNGSSLITFPGLEDTIRINVNQHQPEQLFSLDYTPLYSSGLPAITSFKISASDYQEKGIGPGVETALQNAIKLTLYNNAEYQVDAKSISSPDPLVAAGAVTPVVGKNVVVLEWLSGCNGIPNYQVQVLRLYNYKQITSSDEKTISAFIDWNKALTVETESPDTKMLLRLMEGTGYYVWRVRPIGNYYDGGIGNSQNWGLWSSTPGYDQGNTVALPQDIKSFVFFYQQPEEEKNWIYTRNFSEQNKKLEQIVYANGLYQPKQTQAYLPDENKNLTSSTLYDYSGRQTLSTLAAPFQQTTDSILSFRYTDQFVRNNQGNLYGPEDFDSDLTQDLPKNISSGPLANYYGFEPALKGIGNELVPNAEGYAFTRTKYYSDGSSRKREQSLPGKTHAIGSTHTVKNYYSDPGDEELTDVFGDEAPSKAKVKKVITVDPNHSINVNFLRTDGKLLASCLSLPVPANLQALESSENAKTTITDIVYEGNTAQTVANTSWTVVKNLFFSEPNRIINGHYTITPNEFKASCGNFCNTCDYKIQILFRSVEESNTPPQFKEIPIKGADCTNNKQFKIDFTFSTTDPGAYQLERKIISDNSINSLDNSSSSILSYKNEYSKDYLAELDAQIASNSIIQSVIAKLSANDLDGANQILQTVPEKKKENGINYAVIRTNCCAINVPVKECAEDGCSNLDFEGYFQNVAGASINFMFPSFQPGQFNALIKRMIDENATLKNFAFDCNSLWNCWKSLVGYRLAQANGLLAPALTNIPSGSTPVFSTNGFNVYESPAYVQPYDNMSDDKGNKDLFRQFMECVISNQEIEDIYNNTGFFHFVFTEKDYDGGNGYLEHPTVYVKVTAAQLNSPCVLAIARKINPSISSISVAEINTWSGEFRHDVFNAIRNCPKKIPSDPPYAENVAIDAASSCKKVCQERFESFKFKIISSLESKGYIVQKTPTHQKFDFSINDINCAANQLVETCEGKCGLTVFRDNSGFVTKIGTPQQIQDMLEAMAYSFDLETPCTMTKKPGKKGSSRWPRDRVEKDASLKRTFTSLLRDLEHVEAVVNVVNIDSSFKKEDQMAREKKDISFAYETMKNSLAQDLPLIFNPLEGLINPQPIDKPVSKEPLNEFIRHRIIRTWSSIRIRIKPEDTLDLVNWIRVEKLVAALAKYDLVFSGANTKKEFPRAEKEYFDQEKEIVSSGETYDTPRPVNPGEDYGSCKIGVCIKWKPFPPIANPIHFKVRTCEEQVAEYVLNYLQGQITKCRAERKDEIESKYDMACLQPGKIKEKLWISYEQGYYHYTLYYYDRAGNLVKTVAPAGVDKENNVDRNNRAEHPNHLYVTTYGYNSLKQMVWKHTPDGGKTMMWYDNKGKLRFSQNEKQLGKAYTYSKYDALGRILESGESDEQIKNEDFLTKINFPKFPVQGKEKVISVYSEPSGVVYNVGSRPQRFIQNRLSYALSDEDGKLATQEDQVKTHYSYDPHGNVEWMVEDIPGLGQSTVLYDYDVISNKVTQVAYNEGKLDQFYHRFLYDQNNRIIESSTSRDHVLWDRDSKYYYYPGGALKRKEIGEDKLQGLDYVYTIQGWLKGINHPTLQKEFDPAHDGLNKFGADAFGMILTYYEGDYNVSNSFFNSDDQVNPGLNSTTHPNLSTNENLYNGNISSWASNIQSNQLLPSVNQYSGDIYHYDELNRLTRDNFNTYDTLSKKWVSSIAYGNSYSYDPNGNITRLLRNGKEQTTGVSTTFDMDSLTYHYKSTTNQVEWVDDAVPANLYSDDLDDQNSNNYIYDEIGNTVRDKSAGINNITWTLTGKIKSISKSDGTLITFGYNSKDERIKKEVNVSGNITTIYYTYDAVGNVMAVYEYRSGLFKQSELPIYGATRVGECRISKPLLGGPLFTRLINNKTYELTDHLGNIRLIFSDVKLSSKQNGVAKDFSLDFQGLRNYYPFGLLHAEIDLRKDDYKYGFNGKEKIAEINGDSKYYDFGARIYSTEISRWYTLDPLSAQRASWSPYNSMSDNPISNVDPSGASDGWVEINGEMVHDFRVTDQQSAVELYGKNAINRPDGYKYTTSTGDKVELGDMGFFKVDGDVRSTPDKSEAALKSFSSELKRKQKTLAASTLVIGGIMTDVITPDPSDVVIPKWAVYAVGGASAAYLTYKMKQEIAKLLAKTSLIPGVQYSLQATVTGQYVCHTCPSGTTTLSAGDVWKYGETTNPSTRYSDSYLKSSNLNFVGEVYGTQIQIKIAEKVKIYSYFFNRGHLPPGNKIFR